MTAKNFEQFESINVICLLQLVARIHCLLESEYNMEFSYKNESFKI